MPTILAHFCSCAWNHYHVERPTYLDLYCNFVWWTTRFSHVQMHVHPTLNYVSCSPPQSRHMSQNHHLPITMLHGLMDMLRSNALSISNSYSLWANLMRVRTCLRLINGFFCCTCASNPTAFKACLTMMSKQQFTCVHIGVFFFYCRCSSKSTFNNGSDTMPLLSVCKKLWITSSLSFNLTPCILPHVRYKKNGSCPLKWQLCVQKHCFWVAPKFGAFVLETTEAYIYNNSINCTSCTMKLRLRNAQEISQPSQLDNAHINVGRVAANKSEYCNPKHFNVSGLETLYPIHFLASHLCNWSLGLLLWSLHHFVCDLNWLTMRAEVEFVYNILSFVWYYIWQPL